MVMCQPEEILIRYLLNNFVPDWNIYEDEIKIKIEFLYFLFLKQQITFNHLSQIFVFMGLDLRQTNEILDCALNSPGLLVPTVKNSWSKEEKLLLVTCWVKFGCFDKVCSILPWRTCEGCRRELFRIRDLYETKQKSKNKIITREIANNEIIDKSPLIFVSNNDEKTNNDNFDNSKNISKQLFIWNNIRNRRKLKGQQLIYARKIRTLKTCSNINEKKLRENKFIFLNEFDDILNEAEKNFRKKNGKRYSQSSKAFWVRLMMYSRKAFAMMKDYLNGPSQSTVDQWVKNEKSIPKWNNLESLDQVDNIFQFWANRLQLSSDEFYTISIDAAKVDENLTITSDGEVRGTIEQISLPREPIEYKEDRELYCNLWNELLDRKMIVTHIFVILICPLSPKRSFPIYIKFSNSGSATEYIRNDLDYIINHLKEKGMKIKFIGSDGDKCYRNNFDKQYKRITSLWNNNIINLDEISSEEVIYSNDAYHCLKRLRKAMINNKSLYLKPDYINSSHCVSQSTLQQIDKTLPNCIFRHGSLQSMDDYYPSALFRWKTLRKASKSGNNSVILYLWVGVLARSVMASKHLTRFKRCQMCYIGLFIVVFYKMLLDEWKKDPKTKSSISKMILSPILCIDYANFFSCMIKALTSIPDTFPLSRVGSILSEHFFGRIRRNAENCQTMDAIRSAINKIQFIDTYRKDTNFDDANHRRRLESAVVESGIISFDNDEILKCRDFVESLFHQVQLLVSFDTEIYRFLMKPIYSDINSLEKELLEKENSNELTETKKHWTLNAAQFRVNGRYGRNIKNRYATSAKPFQ